MKFFLSQHKEILALFALALLLLAAGFFAAYFSLAPIAEPLILHWSEYTGIDRIGSVFDLALVAATGLVLWLVNLAFALALEKRDRLLGKIVALGTLFMAALLFLAFVAIISVNT